MPLDEDTKGKDDHIEPKQKNGRLLAIAIEFASLLILLALFTYLGK